MSFAQNPLRRALAVALLAVAAIMQAAALDIPEESHSYSIRYKWGLIEKQAAVGTLSFYPHGNSCEAVLAVRTDPWADRVYCVRDTLKSIMSLPGYIPEEYVKRCHQSNTLQNDVVRYERSGGEVTGKAHRIKRDGANSPLMESDTTLHAQGPTFDMLSVFYYLRSLDMPAMEPGHRIEVNLFSGYKVEQLAITYDGKEKIDVNGHNRETYRFTFTFTENGSPCEEPMYVWYSTDANRIPMKLIGVLPVGRVECYYME